MKTLVRMTERTGTKIKGWEKERGKQREREMGGGRGVDGPFDGDKEQREVDRERQTNSSHLSDKTDRQK